MYFTKHAGQSNRYLLMAIAALFSLCVGLTSAREPAEPIAIHEVIDRVTDRGFDNISEIELSDDGDKYEVKAYDEKRRKVEIEMDARDGTILEIDKD